MPLPKRVVSPVFVSRDTLPPHLSLPNDLEGVTNGTLANVIRQLSSFSRHAEDLFGELTRQAQNLHVRSGHLQARVDRLAQKVTQLDSTVEEVSLQDLHLRKAFRSSTAFDQQVFSRESLPVALDETYRLCDRPPPLEKLNCYRDDGRDGLKFYTDPNYFFELWRQEMLKDTEKIMLDKGKKPHRPRTSAEGSGGQRAKRRVRQPNNTRDRQREIAIRKGEYISPMNHGYTGSPALYPPSQAFEGDLSVSRPPRPNSIEVHRNYYTDEPTYAERPSRPTQTQELRGSFPPPPYDDGYPQYPPPPYSSGYGEGNQGTSLSNLANRTLQRTSSRPSQPPPAPPSGTTTPQRMGTPTRATGLLNARESLPPPPPPPPLTENNVNVNVHNNHGRYHPNLSPPSQFVSNVVINASPLPPPPASPFQDYDDRESSLERDLPPPPPLPEAATQQVCPTPPLAPLLVAPVTAAPPPPPPPPPLPPVLTNGPLASTSPVLMANGVLKNNLTLVSSPPKSSPGRDVDKSVERSKTGSGAPEPVLDVRSDLLKAIREGISLRKVEKGQQREVEKSTGLHDVASILARRVAMEFSESESSDSGSESDAWDDETSA